MRAKADMGYPRDATPYFTCCVEEMGISIVRDYSRQLGLFSRVVV